MTKLKDLNDVSGNLLQIFESKGITSNLETNVKFFMSETLCHFFFFFFFFFLAEMITNEMLGGKKQTIFLSKHTSVWTVEIQCQCDWVLLAKLIATPSSF